MIKVHFEILPHGSMADKYSMGWLQIINDGDEDEGNVLESLTEERTYTYLLFDNRGNLITFGGVLGVSTESVGSYKTSLTLT